MAQARQARAEATRARLLDATVEALVARGYAGTTTQAVCRTAGCSRGTLLYHFPTREALLVAALHRVLSDRIAGFVASSTEPMPPADFARALWAQWQDAPFTAWLELAVASRTNPALRDPLQEIMLDFDEQVKAAFRALVPPGVVPEPAVDLAPFFVFALFNGMAVGQIYEPPGYSEPMITLISQLVGAAVDQPIGGPRD